MDNGRNRSSPAMQITRRTLFDGELLLAAHVGVRASTAAGSSMEQAGTNSLVLPLTGVFAKHDGPRRHFVATPSHAVLIASGSTYGISLPGGIGDESLILRFTPQALARLAPEAMAGDGFDTEALNSHTLLEPAAILARSLLWRSLDAGAADPLAVEEAGASLLASSLRAARKTPGRRHQAAARPQRRRQINRVLEAVSLQPQRKWTLAGLADIACASPWHLAHVFREEAGSSIHQYVIRARLARALDAVLDGDADLTTVALDAGFASHSHFTHRFRSQFGVTPAELRRRAERSQAAQLRKIAIA